jgi:hypothetical protein
MGANLLNVLVTLTLQSPQTDTSFDTSATHGIALERVSDLLQYNRVQGLSLGLGYQVPISGSMARLHATLRYGISDERVTGRLTLLLNTNPGLLVFTGHHDISDLDPFSPGRTIANTLNGLFAGHDNGDYALARGGSVRFERPLKPGLELVLAGAAERLGSVSRVARSAVNDFFGGTGLFPANPPVHEGTFGSIAAQARNRGRTRWSVTADVVGGGGRTTGRLYGDLRRRVGRGWALMLRLKAGAATEPATPQTLFRQGGVNTVRGFEYGSLRAPAFWAGQLDLTPFDGRVRPVLFVDAGQASRTSGLFSSSAIVGAGVGLSLFKGLLRFDLSQPISPDHGGKVRFDLLVQSPR